MYDNIKGLVTEVIDGDTFDVNVISRSPLNKNSYNRSERIRIKDFNAPELSSNVGLTAKEKLQRRIGGKSVTLIIYSRDIYGRLICGVSPN